MIVGIIIFMALMGGYAGGSLPGSQYLNKKGELDENGQDKGGVMPVNLTWVPELLFSVPFAWATAPLFRHLDLINQCIIAGLVTAWCYAWMQSSTGPALHWGRDPQGMGKPRTLSPLVNWISDRLGFRRGDVNYCRTWMAVKGLLITLPVGGTGVLFWPLGYEIGNRVGKAWVSECVSAAGAGVSIYIFSHVAGWLI